MNKNRYLFCLLASGAMLYFALPRLPVYESGLAGIFSISWLVLCLIVIAGNLSGILYTPKGAKATRGQAPKKVSRKRVRYYN